MKPRLPLPALGAGALQLDQRRRPPMADGPFRHAAAPFAAPMGWRRPSPCRRPIVEPVPHRRAGAILGARTVIDYK